MSVAPSAPNVRVPDAGDYREHLPTAERSGRRIWLYPRKPWGSLHRARMAVNAILLTLLFSGPFIRINGEPLLMMNIVDRKFVIFGQIFWPTDLYLFAIGMVTLFIMIVLFTAIFGRVWCGWLCPQTVLMEGVFRKIEYWIEGDAFAQRSRDHQPLTAGTIARKALKHLIFLSLSFLMGHVLLSYIIGSDAVLRLLHEPVRAHAGGFTAMVLFSLLFYGIFARFREQACTFICPYGRFQSVLLDQHSIVVSFDPVRGLPAGKFDRQIPHAQRRVSQGLGDCINCRLCVEVCPTGIDIRNGTQMECINCTACIDACNHTMTKIGFPRGLIRYASANSIMKGEGLTLTPRILLYTTILCVLMGMLAYLLATREDVEATLLRAPGTLYQQVTPERFSNLYLLTLLNKTSVDQTVELHILQPTGGVVTLAGSPVATAGKVTQGAAIVELPRSALHGPNTPIEIGISMGGREIQRLKSNFAGPAP